MTDVFISYKRRLRPKVEVVAARLKALGLDVWFDAELESGSTFSATISHEVRNAKCVLVCWSNDAFPHGGDKHGWVIGEATIGRDREVLVAAFIERADLDPPWNTVHTDDLTRVGERGWANESDWRNVLLAVGKRLGRPGLTAYDLARNSNSPQALIDWAQQFPEDPAASTLLESEEQAELAEAIERLDQRSDNVRSGTRAAARAAVLLIGLLVLGGAGAAYWTWQEGLGGRGRNVPEADLKSIESAASPAQLAPSDLASSEPKTVLAATVTNTSAVGESQALLLEASDNGKAGATPLGGTAEWVVGTDAVGQPTLVGNVNIPARSMTVGIVIRKNFDANLPASHLVDVSFTVEGDFAGGSIAGLTGILLKDEQLVQGAPLVGSSTRVVGNTFLFVLSDAKDDVTANTDMLMDRKWVDVAMIYATGRRAILTIEKDAQTQNLFKLVFLTWNLSTSQTGDLTAEKLASHIRAQKVRN